MNQQPFISNKQFPGTKQQLLKAMLSAFSELVYLYDLREGCIAYVSDNLYDVLGYPADRYASGEEDIKELIHPADLVQVARAMKELLKRERLAKCNARIKHAEQGYRWFALRQVVFSFSESGEPLYVLGILADIHERKETELRIREQNATIKQYIFAASHTVRAPLSNILAIAALMNDTTTLDAAEMLVWAKRMKDQAELLDRIITQMVASIRTGSDGA